MNNCYEFNSNISLTFSCSLQGYRIIVQVQYLQSSLELASSTWLTSLQHNSTTTHNTFSSLFKNKYNNCTCTHLKYTYIYIYVQYQQNEAQTPPTSTIPHQQPPPPKPTPWKQQIKDIINLVNIHFELVQSELICNAAGGYDRSSSSLSL